MNKNKQFTEDKVCYLCGETTGPFSRDNVPSRCLFPKIPPANLIRLPACSKCHNKELSMAEEYFHNVVITLSQDKPLAKTIWDTRVQRSITRKEGEGLRKRMLRGMVPKIDVYSKGGIYLGKACGIDFDLNHTTRVLSKLIRGLYYYHHRPDRIPNDFDISWCVDPPDKKQVYSVLLNEPLNEIGEGMFSYRYRKVVDEPHTSLWGMRFYDTVFFLVFCLPPNRKDSNKSAQRRIMDIWPSRKTR